MDKLINPEELPHKATYLYEVRNEISSDEIVLKDGRIFERYSAPMLGAKGKYYGRVWYFSDITERKHLEAEKARSEAQTRQLQKAESLGIMAGSVSHHEVHRKGIGAFRGSRNCKDARCRHHGEKQDWQWKRIQGVFPDVN